MINKLRLLTELDIKITGILVIKTMHNHQK